MTNRMQTLIGILGFDGVAALDLVGLLEVFKAAHDDRNQACYDVTLLGLNGTNFVSDSGTAFKADKLLRAVSSLDTLIVPSGRAEESERARREAAQWLRAHPLARQPLVSIETGSTGMETALRLIEDDHGARIAVLLARRFGLKPAALESKNALASPPNERLTRLPAWIQSNLRENLTVEALAERACVCPRHFSRLFKSTFKVTPADFVARLRLTEARRQLDRPRAKISAVASAVGFKSADSFRRAFEREQGINPSKFRRRLPTNC